ncbi:MAG: DUF2961 domain-containing protein [Chloroflexi bacterium]|nr:DUF2961 domain-containing protein [Chloroflexota bacterium]
MFDSMLTELPRIRPYRTRRSSSWDRTGGNRDRLMIAPEDTVTLLDVKGAGRITHIWMTSACREPDHLRKTLLKMYWDGETEPSVIVPLGDFFGMGHATTKTFVSLPLVMAPSDGHGFNCYFPMPYSKGARIDVECQTFTHEVMLYYYIDYEELPEMESDIGRFHAQWRRQNPTDGIDDENMTGHTLNHGGKNLTGEGNYVILEAQGQGHYVGCHLDVDNLRTRPYPMNTYRETNWFGEGDDMIFIDGDRWPPTLHGTGTEDYFNLGWGFQEPFSSPFFGVTMTGRDESGKISAYHFHILDPIRFQKSIRVTIEHGHANRRSDDYSSTAYWYQLEPHQPFDILPVEDRLPRPGSLAQETSHAPNA